MNILKCVFTTMLALASFNALADANSAMGQVSTTRGTAPPPTSPPANGSTANKGAPVAPAPAKGPASPGNGGKQISDQGAAGGLVSYKK